MGDNAKQQLSRRKWNKAHGYITKIIFLPQNSKVEIKLKYIDILSPLYIILHSYPALSRSF